MSAGELGTNPRELELELNKILEIAHSWGAILLLDEADVCTTVGFFLAQIDMLTRAVGFLGEANNPR